MKANAIRGQSWRFLRGFGPIEKVFPFAASVSTLAVAIFFLSSAAWAGGVVNNCTELDLRAAITGGGTVTFACDGTITLINTIRITNETVLDGAGHLVTISGGDTVQVFQVIGGAHLTLANLTVANGRGLWGGGISNTNGTVNLISTIVRDNVAVNEDWAPPTLVAKGGNGGAIYSLGTLNATNCLFTRNACRQRVAQDLVDAMYQGSYVSTAALGGAIYNGGQLVLDHCTFDGNGAYASPGFAMWFQLRQVGGSVGRKGAGGAIFSSGPLTVRLCTFTNNAAQSGWSASAGSAQGPSAPGPLNGTAADGGAICSLSQMSISASTFINNQVIGGVGGEGGTAYYNNVPENGGKGGAGGAGNGGALFNGVVGFVTESTMAWNAASGARGGGGGSGGSYQGISSDGGPGGVGGSATGGAVFNGGRLGLVNCTAVSNFATGGPGGYGGGTHGSGNGGGGGAGGDGSGALTDTNGLMSMTNCTFALNLVVAGLGSLGGPGSSSGGIPGPAGTNGVAHGGLVSVGGNLVNCLLATNAPGNCFGWLSDAGRNLSSDTTCAFTNVGSLNGAEPKLGPLAGNGGPTLTKALFPGSPAIDAGDSTNTPSTDQRGFLRPVGPAADIGAFEYGAPAFLKIRRAMDGVNVLVYGSRGKTGWLLASSNLTNWIPIATNQIGNDGTLLFHDNLDPSGACRFYRLAMP